MTTELPAPPPPPPPAAGPSETLPEPARRVPFFRRPAGGWLIAGVVALVAGAVAVALLAMLQSARADLRNTQADLSAARSDLARSRTEAASVERRLSTAMELNQTLRKDFRACSRAEALSVELWNKHIEEMNAALNASRAEYLQLYEEAQALRKQANRAGRLCP